MESQSQNKPSPYDNQKEWKIIVAYFNKHTECHIVYIVLILFSCAISVSTTNCLDAMSCIGQSLNGSSFIYGYKAAFSPYTSFAGHSVDCYGAFSCHSMAFITANYDIGCHGAESCSNTTIRMDSNTTMKIIACYGSQSCSASDIISSRGIVSCYGYKSCAKSHIYGANTIYGSAQFSLFNATIDTNGSESTTINVYLRASFAGFGAKLFCRNGHKCNIYCNTLDACFMFYVNCDGSCSIILTDAIASAPTTNFTQFKYYNHEAESIKSNDGSCIDDVWSFDDYDEKNDNIEITTDNETSVCCRGDSSCRVDKIEFQTQTKHDLVCSGHYACYETTIWNNNNSVFCEGFEGCSRSSINDADVLYCSGYLGCYFANIINTHFVLCRGTWSCASASFISNGTNLDVYLTGYGSGQYSIIYCNDTDLCSVRCIGYASCDGLILYCNDNCITECDDILSKCPLGYESQGTTQRPSQYPSQTPFMYSNTVLTTRTFNETPVTDITTSSNTLTEQTQLPSQYPLQTPFMYSASTSTTRAFNQTPNTDTGTSSNTSPTSAVITPPTTIARKITLLIVVIFVLFCAISLIYMLIKKKRKRERDRQNDEKNVAESIAEDDADDNSNVLTLQMSSADDKKQQEMAHVASFTDIVDEKEEECDEKKEDRDSDDSESASNTDDMYIAQNGIPQRTETTKGNDIVETCDTTSGNEAQGEGVQPMEGKDDHEVVEWLQGIGMAQYVVNFLNNGFDSLQSVLYINEDKSLNEIGIVLVAHKLKILAEIGEMRNNDHEKVNETETNAIYDV